MLQRIGRYEVQGEIARGGMGAVLRARDPQLGRDVAIKILTAGSAASEAARRRFATEGRALGRLKHPNIVAVHETGQVRDWPYIVMDFVDGESLDARIERDGPLPVDEAVAVAATLARALVHAHQEGIVHRDLKPGNVLLGRDGVVRLGDFGLAKDLLGSADVAGGMTRSGVFLGTPGFLPPEQAMGRKREVGPASDVYGLGATLYAALTGVAPHEADDLVSLVAIMHEPPKPPSAHRPGIPGALDDLVLRCLRASPADRPALAAVADQLETLRGERPASHARRGARSRRSNAPALAGGLAIVAVGVAVAVALVARRQPPPPPPTPPPPPATTTTTPPPVEPPVTEAQVAPVVTDAEPTLLAQARTALQEGRFDDGLVLAERFVASSAGDPRGFVVRGDARVALEDLAGAVRDWTKALDLEPAPEVLWRRALARKKLGEGPGVVADCGRVLALAGARRDVLSLRAGARADLGEREGAVEDYRAAIALEPTAGDLVDVGKLEFDQGHFEVALADYDHAASLDEKSVAAHLGRSATLHRLGRHVEALAPAEEAVALRPDLSWCWARRGSVLLDLGRAQEAVDDFDRALALGQTGDPGLLQSRSMALRHLGRAAEALTDAEAAMRLEPDTLLSFDRLATALIDVKRFEEAGALLDRAVTLHSSPQLHFLRAVCKDELHDPDGALASYQASLALEPEQSTPHFNIGILLDARGDHAGARDAYTKAIARADRAVYHLNRAEARRHLGDPAGALEDVEQALTLEPKNLVALAARAVLHMRAGRFAEARPDLDALAVLQPKNVPLLYSRAACLETVGERALARAAYEHICEVSGPDSQTAKRARERIQDIDAGKPPPRFTYDSDPPAKPTSTEKKP